MQRTTGCRSPRPGCIVSFRKFTLIVGSRRGSERADMVVQHRQIADDLRRLIAESVYPPGACLPPESELAARYGVSRGTVRQAVIALQLEGLLDTRRGARRTVLRA